MRPQHQAGHGHRAAVLGELDAVVQADARQERQEVGQPRAVADQQAEVDQEAEHEQHRRLVGPRRQEEHRELALGGRAPQQRVVGQQAVVAVQVRQPGHPPQQIHQQQQAQADPAQAQRAGIDLQVSAAQGVSDGGEAHSVRPLYPSPRQPATLAAVPPQPLPIVVLRAPLLPLAALRDPVAALRRHPLGAAAVGLASPDLAAALSGVPDARGGPGLAGAVRPPGRVPADAGRAAGGRDHGGAGAAHPGGDRRGARPPRPDLAGGGGAGAVRCWTSPQIRAHVRLRAAPSLLRGPETAIWLAFAR